MELCFDRPIQVDRIDDPADWLRAWVVVAGSDSPNASAPEAAVRRIELRPVPEATVLESDAHRLVFAFAPGPTIEALEAGANERASLSSLSPDRPTTPARPTSSSVDRDNSSTPVRPSPRHRCSGCGLVTSYPTGLGRAIWCRPEPSDCIGDGYDGGVLHAAFHVGPVTPAPAATGLAPHNGARVRTQELPTIELNSTVTTTGSTPQAWLIDHRDRIHPLTVGEGTPLSNDRPARALDRYASSFDDTVLVELANTMSFPVTGSDSIPTRGRVLVVMPSTDVQGQVVGSFRGTCLDDAEVANIAESGLGVEHLDRVRPSRERMPRAGDAGNWIHWTFVWEQSNVDII